MIKNILISILLCINLFALNYEKEAKDIKQRLSKAVTAYEKGDINKAKKGFSSAYFEVFENLEGPIRINISAKKAYELEAQFGDLRKMVKKQVSPQELKTASKKLIKEIYEVLPELGTYTLVAEKEDTQNNKTTPTINEHWKETLIYIQKDLRKALDAYSPENSQKSREYIKDAQFQGYRNTGLEIAVRKEISAKIDGELQLQFRDLIRLMHEKPSKEVLEEKINQTLSSLFDATKDLKVRKNNTKKVKTQTKDYSLVANEIKKQFLKAFNLYDNGKQKEAISLIQDTYFDIFEASGMEGAIGAKNTSLKVKLESHFSKIIGALKNNSTDERQKVFKLLDADLQNALKILTPTSNTPWQLFIWSLTIILREGLEALLIVTAIMAYLIKSGNKNKINIVYSSLSVAIILSFATAWIMNVIFGTTAGENRELLEGITMLVAALLLFYVSYWLISNANAQKWNKYINEQISESLSSGNIKTLWLTVFLAVYREGAETVLFYQALISDINSNQEYTYLAGGFLAGLILLFIIYFVLKFTALRLPIKPFFLITGIFIYVMCFMFVGQGVVELIEAKVLTPTLIENIPTITSLGIYPYIQSLLPQAIVLILGLIGLFFIKKKN